MPFGRFIIAERLTISLITSCLVAERLVEKGVPKAQVPVITFGAPAVGNKAFADVYGKRID